MASIRSLNKRSTTILIAAVLALGTGLLAYNYLSSASKVVATVPMRSVVLSTQDIPVRTVVTPAMLTVAVRPADSVNPDAVASVNDAAGQIALISIPAGSAIGASIIGRIALGGLSVRIPGGERAISIALDRVKGVADLIEAGDHVDVIAIAQSHGAGSGGPAASTILTNKTVLAMGSLQEAPVAASGASPTPDITVETATLAVTPQEAKLLALADLNATLRLALRSVKDIHRYEKAEPFAANAEAFVAAPRSAAVAPVAIAPRPPRSPAPRRTGPPLIDGDHYVNQ